jgi:TonB-dependent SusC/RagA subfamily outer membrane receptor
MRKLLLILLAWLSAAAAMAQTRVAVTGKVTDKTGAEIPGVTVLVKGTGQGAATDVNGVFKLNCAPDSRLVFSFLGYVAQEVPLEGRTTINVSLASDSKQLDDVVVVGYGTQTKAEFTGAAARVSGDAVKDLPVQSFDQGLAGKATGVSIGQPNGVLNNAPVIRIRGVNSISLSSYPLIVVDGIPINTGNLANNTTVANNPLGDINPADIASIDVLKDAASTAIYGSRGRRDFDNY